MATYRLNIHTTTITSYTQNSPFNIYIGDDYVEDITNNIIVWTYSGTGTFLGLSRNGGTSTPDYGIGSTILINNSDVTTTYYKVASVLTRKWLLNQNITDLVPDGSDFQHLDFNYNYYAPTETISSYCTLVMMGVMSPFSTWQQFVTQLPSALEALGLTDVSSTLDASNVPSDFKVKLKSTDCEFVGNESDGYWFGSNYGYDVLEVPNITGTISLTYEGDSYTLTLLELDTAMREVFDMPLFDNGAMTYYDIDSGYLFDRTWEITGGKDADDAVFYNWLQNNAIEIVGPQYISSIDISNKNYLFKDNELRLALEEFIDLLPVPTIADSGKYLGVDSTGHLALISPTPPGYTVTVTNGTSVDNVVIYDGQDNTGTQLGVLLMGTTESYNITSGYIYAEWDDPYITDDITFAESGSDIGNPIQVTSDMSIEVWDVEPVVPYLTFSSPNSFTLATANSTKNWDSALEYSTDKTTWSIWSGTSAISSGVSGNKNVLYLRGTVNTYITGDSGASGKWVLTGSNISCNGNIENLLDYETVANGNHPYMASNCYFCLFYECTALTTAPQLPATTLANYCYRDMFYGCTALTIAPSLPATTMTTYCYCRMFRGCTLLTTPPALPATTLATYCYYMMFLDCTSLTTVPQLPATTLSNYCYYMMFQGCTALTTAPQLPATTLANYCYREMFHGCTALTIAPSLPATTMTTYCYYGMFQGCTSLTTPPALPATTLASNCYQFMFGGCTSLTTIPSLPATTLNSRCYYVMFSGCTNIKLSTTQTGEYQTAYRIPTNGTGTTASNALNNMFTNTGGTFTGTPTINITYYTSNATLTGYSVTVTNDSGIDDVYIYDGTDETSTLKGILVKGQTITYIITSGYIYAKWYDSDISIDCSLINGGVFSNPMIVSSNESLSVGTMGSVVNVEITNNSGVDNVRLNDGYARDLGVLLIGETQTYVLLNGGLLYGEWDDSSTSYGLTFAEWGNPLGNPVFISNDTSLEVLAE